MRRSDTGLVLPGGVGRKGQPLRLAMTLTGGLVGLALIASFGYGNPDDLHAYYATSVDHIYARATVGTVDAYLYSPAFIQAFHPLTLLPFAVAEAVWRGLLLGAVVLLAGPLAIVAVLLPPVAMELNTGNIHVLLGLAIVAGFRWPAAWALVLLTKVTPGVGLLWFAARREWRNLAVALAATAAIVGASAILAPAAWPEWLGLLAANATGSSRTGWSPGPGVLPIPLLVRLPVAVVLVVWGARLDRREAVPIAAMLALPVVWFSALSMLVAVIPLWSWPSGRRDVGTGASAGSSDLP